MREHFSNILNQEIDALVKKINVIKIGKIDSISSLNFEVKLIEKSVYNDKIQSMPNLTCKILKNNGFIESYKVGDYVVIGFSDINYSDFHNGIPFFAIDYNSAIGLMHSKSNGYILSRIEMSATNSLVSGIKEEDAEITINRDSKKINIKNSTTKLDEIIQDKATAINQLFTLCVNQNQLIITAFQTLITLANKIKTLTINQTPFDNKDIINSEIQALTSNVALETANNTLLQTKDSEFLTKTIADLKKLFI